MPVTGCKPLSDVFDRLYNQAFKSGGMHMNSTRCNKLLLAGAVFAALYLCLPKLVQGQAISGDLVGTVTDSTHAVIPSATVVAVQTTTNATATVKANQNGEFRFVNLPIGAYTGTASAPGLNTQEASGV